METAEPGEAIPPPQEEEEELREQLELQRWGDLGLVWGREER